MADSTGDSTGAALTLDSDCRLLAPAHPSKRLAFRLILGHLGNVGLFLDHGGEYAATS